MISELINKLTKKQRIISLILFIFVVLFFIFAWFFLIKKNTYKITYYPENGTKSYSVKINEGNHADIPTQPFIDGYEFQYWSEDRIHPFDFNQQIKSDHKLYAVYLKICNVAFICDGKEYSTDKVLEGNLLRTPTEPVKTGFSFNYWEFNGSKFDFSTPVKEDMTLLAKFVTRIPCQSISFSEDSIYVGTEESLPIDIKIEPAECTDKPVIHIDDKEIAAVNSDNTIIGIMPGQTRVTVTCGDHKSEAVLICAEEADYIVIDNDQFTIDVGESIDIKATVVPAEASVYRLRYSVEDSNIAFINEKGVITGRNGGTTKVTVTSSNGRSTSALVYVNGASLELSGLPSSFYTSYSPDSTKYPVKLLYTEWKNGEKRTDTNCEGALLQCSIDAVTYKDGYIIQDKPVDFTMSSEIFFTYMTCKSNSSFIICEPTLEVKDTENLTKVPDLQYKANSSDIAAQITMNCSGTWSVIQGGSDISFSSDPVSCSFIPLNSEIILKFVSTGGQTLEIQIIA